MAAVTVQQVKIAGLSPTFAAAASGDTVECGPHTFIVVKNGSASAVTVTLTSTATLSGLTVEDPTVSVAASGEEWIGPLWPPSTYANSSGAVAVAYSATTTVTRAAIKV